MRLFASSAVACPSTDTEPESGKRIDMIIRIVVVLPAPLGPMKPYKAPCGMARAESVTAFVAPNVLHTFWSRIALGMAVESTAPETSVRGDMFRPIHRVVVIAAVLALWPVLAAAHINLSGDWAPRMHEDQPDRGPGPELGDYTGLPITEGARLAADTWDASRLTLREDQCI